MATKQITINKNIKINMDSSIGWLLIYRENFGRDILPDILPIMSAAIELISNGMNEDGDITLQSLMNGMDYDIISEAMLQLSGLEITTVVNIVWALSKNYAKKNNKDMEPVETWVDQFDEFPLDVIVPATFKLIAKSSISSKNLKSLSMKTKKTQSQLKPLSLVESAEDSTSQA